jgi:prepilin-type processing-associated H-X9-DG protein
MPKVFYCAETVEKYSDYSMTYGAVYASAAPYSWYLPKIPQSIIDKTVLVGCSWCVKNKSPYPRMNFYNYSGSQESYGRPYLIHGKRRVVFLFVDGHAAAFSKEEIKGQKCYSLFPTNSQLLISAAADASGAFYYQLN